MNTQNELQLQIEKLTIQHNFKNEVSEKLGSIKHIAFLSGRDNTQKRLVITCSNSEDFKKVLELYPSSNKNQKIGTATEKYHSLLKTPFRIDIDNPCSPSQYHNFTAKVSFISNDIDIQCELPISEILDFVVVGERSISDSEHHYFTGVSYTSLRAMKVRCYYFKNNSQINWYGGNKTLTDTNETNDIISHLIN